nr:translation initiation factor 2 [Cryptomonas sp. NIES-345]BDA98416.1 translation initiation factor 2 [Cryptomonas sp. NIES-1327]
MSKDFTNCLNKSSRTSLLSMSLPNSKNIADDTLYLNSPLSINHESLRKNKIELTIATQIKTDQVAPIINLKNLPKGDKRLKKTDKSETVETEENNKYKLKKKSRSKLNFDDELESTNDLTNLEKISDKSTIILERPIKPGTQKINISVNSKKLKTSINEKKLKTIVNKKNNKNIPLVHKEIILTTPITLEELSNLSLVSKSTMIKSLFLKGISITANKLIDPTLAQKLGEEFGINIIINTEENLGKTELPSTNDTSNAPRPPIITIMGHVDHGKTTLLDKIRNTQLAQKEIGGITQKIGAYEVLVPYNDQLEKIIFLDTPGHEAFSKMRSRGISISDIAILVVAADDGVRPQTIEAIEQIQSAKVPIIVAINKIDKDNADTENIKRELTKYNLLSEEWGGDTLMVPISALQETNIDKLLETVIILKEILELKAKTNVPAKGIVLESNLDKSKGAIASLILREGILNTGDVIVIDNSMARIRGMMDSKGKLIKEINPSSPALIWGLQKIPAVGSSFLSFKEEKEAKAFMESNKSMTKSNINPQIIFDNVESSLQNKKQINLIIKTDSQGSLEAVTSNLAKLCSNNVQIRILNSSVGEITETDVEFANTSKSNLLAFNTTYATGVKKGMKDKNIDIKEFNIIYDLFDYVQILVDEKNGPQYQEHLVGSGVVQTIFPLTKSFVAGTSVIKGKILKSSFIHVIRNSEILYKGYIDSLKRIKEDVLEVPTGSDCGIFINKFNGWKPGDIIEAFNFIQKKDDTL